MKREAYLACGFCISFFAFRQIGFVLALNWLKLGLFWVKLALNWVCFFVKSAFLGEKRIKLGLFVKIRVDLSNILYWSRAQISEKCRKDCKAVIGVPDYQEVSIRVSGYQGSSF